MEVQSISSESSHKSWLSGWVIWLLPTIFMFYQYGVQVMPSLEVHFLESHFLVNKFKIAMLSSFYLFPYVVMQLPAGLAIDQYDARKILTISMGLFTIGTVCVYLSHIHYSYAWYVVSHLLMGMGASTGFIGSLYLANLHLHVRHYRLAISLTQVSAMLGVFAISAIFSLLITLMDWPQVILINLIFCIFLTIAFWFFIRDGQNKIASIQSSSVVLKLRHVLKNRQIWLCALYAGLVFSPMIVLTNTWRVDFLEKIYHLSQLQATIDNGYSIFGYILGAPFYGALSRCIISIRTLKKLIVVSAAATSISLLTSHFILQSLVGKIICYFLTGFFMGNVVLCFALVKELVGDGELATGTAFVNMVEISIGMILTPVVGYLLDLLNGNYMLAALPVIITVLLSVLVAFVFYRQK